MDIRATAQESDQRVSSPPPRRHRVTVHEWSQRCAIEARDNDHEAEAEAKRLERQLQAAAQSTRHVGDMPHAFRTAVCMDVLAQIGLQFDRFHALMRVLTHELARAVYVKPPPLPLARKAPPPPATTTTTTAMPSGANDAAAASSRVHRFFSQRTFFAQLQHVLATKTQLEAHLHSQDALYALLTQQLRTHERMVDAIACRWARVVLRQTLVDWKKIIVRKKYTRVLLDHTRRRWTKQRLARLFRRWTAHAQASKIAKARDAVRCGRDQLRDVDELLHKMAAQIDSAATETKAHREHFDFAKRQILSLEELLRQLEQRVANSHERTLQTIVNAWGELCLALVECQLTYLQSMVDALPAREFVDVSLLLHTSEELPQLLRLPADALVLRWINFHFHFHAATASAVFRRPEPSVLPPPSPQSNATGFIQNFGSDMRHHYVLRHIVGRLLDDQDRHHRTRKPASNTGSRPACAPFQDKHELRTALAELLDPPCPPLLSAHVLERAMPSDMAFALFSFLMCEHPALRLHGSECPWHEALLALDDARSVWHTIRVQWTELHTPFAVREVAAAPPDLTSPPHLLVRGNVALQNAVNMVQYACAKRSASMQMWKCVQRTVQQDALRVLLRRGRQQPPWEMLDRRMDCERAMLTTLEIPKLVHALATSPDSEPLLLLMLLPQTEMPSELVLVQQILGELYDPVRRVYRYYASIDVELQRTDHFLRHHAGSSGRRSSSRRSSGATCSGAGSQRDADADHDHAADDEERFFRKLSASMSLVEFHVFLKDCRVFGSARPLPYAFITRVFQQVNADLATPSHASCGLGHDTTGMRASDTNTNAGNDLTPAEFVEALVHIAASKYLRLRHTSAASTAALPLAERFRRLLVDVVLPNAMQEKERVNAFHEQLLAPPCREILAKHHRPLVALYARFAALEMDVSTVPQTTKQQQQQHPPPPPLLLSVNGLVVLLKHYELLRENYLNLDDVQHILCQVLQLERESIQFELSVVATYRAKLEDDELRRTSAADAASTSAVGQDKDVVLLTFAEFLQVIAAVVCYLKPDAFVPLAEKLDDFIGLELRQSP